MKRLRAGGWSNAVHPDDLEHTKQVWNQAIKTKSRYEVEYRVRRHDGVYRLFEVRGVPVFKKDGSVLEWVGTCIDITERKKLEASLRESEERFLLALKKSPVVVGNLDRDLRFTWAYNLQSGYNSADLIGKEFGYGMNFEDMDSVQACLNEVITKGTSAQRELKGKGLGGERVFDFYFEPKRNSQNEITGLSFTALNITDRKKTETEREIMVEFLRIANATTGTRDMVKAATVFFQKQSGCEAVGIRLKEGDDYPYYESKGFPPEHVQIENKLCASDEAGYVIRDAKGEPVLECMCGNIICGRFDPNKEFFTKKGSFWTNSTTQLIANTTQADRQGNTRNRCNSEGFESLALIPLRIGDTRLGLLQLNDKRKDMFTLETILMWERIADRLALALSRNIAEEALSISLEESQLRESEISALLKASRAVLQNKEFQDSARAIFDACKELIGATAGYVALLSDNGKENEVLFLDSGGLPCTVDPSLPMPIRGLRAEAYNSGKVAVENDFNQSEWKKFMPKGHVQLKNVLFAPLMIEQRTVGVIGLANKAGGFTKRDAEMAMAFGEIASVALANSQMLEMLEENEKELKAHSEHLETLVEERTKKLRDSERLAAIGETAGMVGHDIRNPLQSITGELYLARTNLASLPDTHAKEDLNESIGYIEEQLIYVNKIVQDLQDYAKIPKPQLQETDLEKTVQDVLSSMNIPETITVSYSLEAGFPKINTDPLYLKRILTNLTSNAIQAMPNGGKLDITATLQRQESVHHCCRHRRRHI